MTPHLIGVDTRTVLTNWDADLSSRLWAGLLC